MPTQEEADRLVRLAQTAYDRGDRLLQLQLAVGTLTGEPSRFGSFSASLAPDDSVGYLLGQVELAGWRLEHTGYAFAQTGSSSSQRIFSSGEGVVNEGAVVGYYVFRRVEPSS